MSTRELIASDRPPLEAARAALRVWFTTRVGDFETVDRVYYDSFDGLLHDAGLVLWAQPGLIKLGRLDDSAEVMTAPLTALLVTPCPLSVLGSGDQQAALTALVSEHVGVRALLEIARVRIHSETLNVLDRLEKTVARVHVDLPVVAAADGSSTPLTPRVRVTGMRGYDRELRKTKELLTGFAKLEQVDTPLVDEAVAARGGRPGGVSSGVTVRMDSDERADVVAARVLTRLLQVLDATLPGAVKDIDAEFLHDYRVAIRRTRSVLKEMPGVFPAEDLRYIRTGFRWLQEVTGQTRDLDVWSLEFDQLRELAPVSLRDHLGPLRSVIASRHASARVEMEAALRSDRAQDLHAYWASLLQVLVLEDEDGRPDAARAIAEVAAKRIRRVHRHMVKLGRRIEPDSDPQDYHDLRKRGKELRYLLELFGSQLYDPEVVKPMVKTLKGLQRVLGTHQDREVQINTLKELAPEIMRQPDGAQALMAVGALVDKLEEDAASCREQFAESFAEFASPAQVKLVHDTFKT